MKLVYYNRGAVKKGELRKDSGRGALNENLFEHINIVNLWNIVVFLGLPITTRCPQEKHIIHQLESINGVMSLFWTNSYSRLLSKEVQKGIIPCHFNNNSNILYLPILLLATDITACISNNG